MPVSKGRHLVMFDRRMIEDMLRDGECVGAIAGKVGVSWATVAREIKRHRTRDTTHYQNLDGKNLCQFRDSCRMTSMCRTGCNSRCSRCASAACNKVCEKYVEVPECPKLARAPYVCNGCRSRITLTCRHRCWFYDADAANEEAAWAKVAGRQGVDCSPEELAAMVAVVKPLMRKGQSLSHIWQTHGSEFPVGARTFYRYINLGILDICNLELPRKVKYKPRQKRKKGEAPFRHSLEGRTYEDFQKLDYDAQMSAVEMDCVVSAKGSDKAILTLLLRRFCFRIMVMLPAHTSECATRALDNIEMLCGRQAFMDSFNVLLTDRGVRVPRLRGDRAERRRMQALLRLLLRPAAVRAEGPLREKPRRAEEGPPEGNLLRGNHRPRALDHLLPRQLVHKAGAGRRCAHRRRRQNTARRPARRAGNQENRPR